MNELKLYRVTMACVFHTRTKLTLDFTVMAQDRDSAIRAACHGAGYTSVSHAAAIAGLSYCELAQAAQVKEIADRIHAVSVPFTDDAIEASLLVIASDGEKLPDSIARAIQHWLASERLKRRQGELADDLDVSWIPGLVASFDEDRIYILD